MSVNNPYADNSQIDELREAAYAPDSFPWLANIYRWSIILAAVTFVLGAAGILAMFYTVVLPGHLVRVFGEWEIWVMMAPMLPFYVFCVRAAVFFMIMIYRCWEIVQDGHARTSPQRMIWLLALPLFNLYWIFVAVAGLAREMNDYCARHRIGFPTVRLGTAGPTVACVFMVVPGLNLLAPFLLISVTRTFGRMAHQIQTHRLEEKWIR